MEQGTADDLRGGFFFQENGFRQVRVHDDQSLAVDDAVEHDFQILFLLSHVLEDDEVELFPSGEGLDEVLPEVVGH